MWEAIGQALKAFTEKYLVPTVIAVVCGLLSILILPEDNWAVLKLGRQLFFLLCAGISFLVVLLLIKLYSFYERSKKDKQKRRLDEKELEKQMDAGVHKVWGIVDGFTAREKSILVQLLETDNEPIKVYGDIYSLNSRLIGSDWMVKTSLPEPGRIQFRLSDERYRTLKYSMDNYGKISNFEIEKIEVDEYVGF